MTALVAGLLCTVLAGVALLHLHWAAGGCWPVRDAASLPRTVIGARADRMPPRVVTLAVAAASACAALLPPWAVGWLHPPLAGIAPHWLPGAACAVGALVLGARGVLGYTAIWQRIVPREPFATLDRRLYSPLCLSLAAGFAHVALASIGGGGSVQ